MLLISSQEFTIGTIADNHYNEFQGCLRNNPNAFFAKRVIVCEGATEVGICRALNEYRINNESENLETLGISLVDGTGTRFVEYADHFNNAGFDVCILCDSDDDATNKKKEGLRNNNIQIVDCDDGNSIEQQLFLDLPWEKILKLLKYAMEEHSNVILQSFNISTLDELTDTPEIRKKIGDLAKGNGDKRKGWYKRIDHGEVLGRIWFESLEAIKNSTLKIEFDNLISWIDR